MAKPIRSWFNMRAANGVGVINIYDEIGGYGISFLDFKRTLDELGDVSQIKLSINSDGGDVFDGFAIYNALQLHPAQKSVTIMGLAASMASVIAMTGDTRSMPANAVMMIHNPVGAIVGNSDELISYGKAVGDMRDKIAQTYVDASGGKISAKTALSLMDKQTWLSAQDALKYGLATDIIEPVKMAARFDLTRRFGKVPESFNHLTKESTMKTKPNADDAAMFEGTAEDHNEAVATAVTKDRADRKALAKEVTALCRIAGKPELAAKFVDEDKTVSEVVVALDALKANGKGKDSERETELSAHRRVETGDAEIPVIDPVAIWDRYNGVSKAKH